MSGTKAEQNLIAAVAWNEKAYHLAEGLVSRSDFSDDRLGIIYEQLEVMISKGETIDPVTLSNRFPEWGVRNIDFAHLSTWNDENVYFGNAGEYARAVRNDALRRSAVNVAQYIGEASRDGGAEPADLLTKARNLIDKAIDNTVSDKIQVKTLAEVLSAADKHEWVIPDLLERQERLILTGAEGGGKTTLMRQITIMSAAGLHPFSREVEFLNGREIWKPTLIQPVRVLVIDAENTERQWRRAVRYIAKRAAEVGVLDPANEIHLSAGFRIDVTKGTDLAGIHRLIDVHQPDLVVIGPIYKISPGGLNDEDDALHVLNSLDSLRERGVALALEAHAAKGDTSGRRDWRPIGSSAQTRWPEFGFGVDRAEGESTAELVAWRGQREIRKWPRHMRFGDDWPWEAA